MLADENGVPVCKYEYDAWGNLLSMTGDTALAALNPIRYRGYYQDTETGLYYLQSRYYDPTTMRFINADDPNIIQPGAAEKQELNLYAYCTNDPVNHVDPTGYAAIIYVAKRMLHYAVNYALGRSISGFILSQAVGNASKMSFGNYQGSRNGCGWIATYNALYMLGVKRNPAHIILWYETHGMELTGIAGVMPWQVSTYFRYYGYKVTLTYNTSQFDSVAKKNKANIIFYWHSKGAHYVALKWTGSKFKGYNTFSNSYTVDDWSRSISGFLRSYGYSGSILISIS